MAMYGVDQTIIAVWRKHAIERVCPGCSRGRPTPWKAREGEIDKLHAKIGQLVELHGQPNAGAAADGQDGPVADPPEAAHHVPHPEHRTYKYLLRGLVIDRSNQVWRSASRTSRCGGASCTWWRSMYAKLAA